MKHLTLITLALVALVTTANAQLNVGDTPAFTNSVQLIWNSNQLAQLTALRAEDYTLRLAAWTAATNANPSYATSNSVPTKGAISTWVTSFLTTPGLQNGGKTILASDLQLADAQRAWRANNVMAANFAAAQALFSQALALLTPTQQATQSNVWWTAWNATQ